MGQVSLGGHSLGSLILFDLLAHQPSGNKNQMPSESVDDTLSQVLVLFFKIFLLIYHSNKESQQTGDSNKDDLSASHLLFNQYDSWVDGTVWIEWMKQDVYN